MFAKKVVKPNIKPLIDYLKEQNTLLDTVAQILVKESEAINARNSKEIETLATQKSELMLKLQANDQKIKLHPNANELKTSYVRHVDVIKQKLRLCKRRNEINGKLIDLSLASARRLSAVLMHSRDKSTMNMTYTPKGMTTATGPMRLNVSA